MDLPGQSATQSEAQAQGGWPVYEWKGECDTQLWLASNNELWMGCTPAPPQSLGFVNRQITREMHQLALSHERVKFLEKALEEMWTEFGNEDYDDREYPNMTEWLKEREK